jgi:hypothetical protein
MESSNIVKKPNFVLCSKSKLKKNVLKNSFVELFNNYKLTTIKGNNTGTEQPFGIINTFKCAKMRLKNVNNYSYAISIENGVFKNEYGFLQDICAIVVKDCKFNYYYDNKNDILNTAIMIPDSEKMFEEIKKSGLSNNKRGYNKTFGKLLSEIYNVPHNNWMEPLCNFSRKRQIEIGFKYVLREIENHSNEFFV